MAMLTGTFNPNAEAQQDFSPIPSGEYLAHITDSDMKPTAQNNGHYLELVYEITDGEAKGRKLWLRLNLDNPNEKTVEIANRQFAAIREATGVANPKQSEELHYKPHVIRVEMFPAGSPYQYGSKKGQPRERAENEIKGWKKADGAAPAAPSAPAAATNAGASPWAKRAA